MQCSEKNIRINRKQVFCRNCEKKENKWKEKFSKLISMLLDAFAECQQVHMLTYIVS